MQHRPPLYLAKHVELRLAYQQFTVGDDDRVTDFAGD